MVWPVLRTSPDAGMLPASTVRFAEGAQMFGLQSKKSIPVTRRYIAALNARDPEAIESLLAENCRVVDSRGGWVEGRDAVMQATRRFFEIEHRFKVEESSMVMRAGDVLIRGRTRASDPRLAQDTLWLARVRDGRVTYWQSFGAGNPPALARILAPDDAHYDEGDDASQIGDGFLIRTGEVANA